mgnify:CR=1 FL=1
MTRYFLIILFISSILFANNNRRSCLNHSEESRARPERDTFILSPSGNFHIHYDVEGYNAPDLDDLNTPNAIQYLVKQAKLAKNNNEELAKLRYNCDLLGIKNNNVKNDISAEDKEAIQKLIIERELARKNKDFAQADLIRVKLSSLNVELEDTPDGATWKIKH